MLSRAPRCVVTSQVLSEQHVGGIARTHASSRPASPSPTPSPSPTSLRPRLQCPASRYVNVSGSDSLEDCKRCPAGRFSHEQGAQLCHCVTYWSCGDAEAWKTTPAYKDCNPAAQNCESSSFQAHLRPTSRYHLCRDPKKYKELAAANTFDFELDANDLDDLNCDDFVDDDYNYDMEELTTKRERRETDGRYADSTKPQPLF